MRVKYHGIFPTSPHLSYRHSPPCSSRGEPMPKQYHAFGTIQLCYPSGFYVNSLRVLRLPRNTNPKHHNPTTISPSQHPSTTVLGVTRKRNAETPLLSAPVDTMAGKGKTLVSPDSTTSRRESGVLGTGNPAGGDTRRVNPHSNNPLRRRRGPCVDVTARAPRLQPLPSAARGQPFSAVSGEENVDRRRGSGKASYPKARFTRQRRSRSEAGCLTEAGDGNGYWDIMGRKACGGDDHHSGDVRAGAEQSESAVASVVLLRWAMECFAGNEDEGIVDGASNGDHRFGAYTLGDRQGDDRSSVRGISAFPGKAMNATISGPVHLMHAERKPRDGDLFLFSDPSDGGGERCADDASNSSPRKLASASSFAATSPAPSAFSRSRNSERPEEADKTLARELRVSVGGGRERRSPPEGSHRGSVASDVSVTFSPRRQEIKHAASGEERSGGRNSWVAGRPAASRGGLTEDERSAKRYAHPKRGRCYFLSTCVSSVCIRFRGIH